VDSGISAELLLEIEPSAVSSAKDPSNLIMAQVSLSLVIRTIPSSPVGIGSIGVFVVVAFVVLVVVVVVVVVVDFVVVVVVVLLVVSGVGGTAVVTSGTGTAVVSVPFVCAATRLAMRRRSFITVRQSKSDSKMG